MTLVKQYCYLFKKKENRNVF